MIKGNFMGLSLWVVFKEGSNRMFLKENKGKTAGSMTHRKEN